jgi:hypothetical protein
MNGDKMDKNSLLDTFFIKGYTLSQNTLQKWEQIFVPDFDLFYFEHKPDFVPSLKVDELDKSVLSLDIRTSFLTWSIDKKANYVSRVSNEQFIALSKETKEYIWREQKRLNRGLVFTIEDFMNLIKGADQNEIHESLNIIKPSSDLVAIQGFSWSKLSQHVRKIILLNYASEWVDEQALSIDAREPIKDLSPVLFPYVDSFPAENGPNCLAAVAAAITNSTAFINQWMQPDPFLRLLKEQNYFENEDRKLKSSDVIVWFNPQNQPVHAAYLLNETLAFNKHGQTMFNPWQAIGIDELLDSWEDFEYRIFSKNL